MSIPAFRINNRNFRMKWASIESCEQTQFSKRKSVKRSWTNVLHGNSNMAGRGLRDIKEPSAKAQIGVAPKAAQIMDRRIAIFLRFVSKLRYALYANWTLTFTQLVSRMSLVSVNFPEFLISADPRLLQFRVNLLRSHECQKYTPELWERTLGHRIEIYYAPITAP